MIFSLTVGFALGLAVSIINHFLVIKTFNGNTSMDNKNKKKLMTRSFFRYFLNFIALFIVYKNPPMLIATAIGLTMVKNYILLQYTLGKKGVS